MDKRRLSYTALCALLLLAACGGSKSVPATSATPEEAQRPVIAGPDKRAEVMRLFMEATQARLGGRPVDAIDLYQRCLKVDPQNDAAMFELGKLYHQGQQPVQAIDFAKRAVAAERTNIWYRFLLADLYQQYGKPQEAADTYRGVLATWPERYEVHLDLANTLSHMGKVSDAIKVYADMEKQFGLTEELIMQQFGMLAAHERLDDAEKLVKRAIAARPREATYQGLLAELYDQRGEHDKALEQYLKALELDPGNSMMRIALAEHYYGTGQLDPAFEQLGFAFQDPEMDLDAKMQVLLGFFEMSNFDGQAPSDRSDLIARSYALIELLEKAHPESGKPHTIHGDFLLRDGRLAEARDQFRIALRQEKDRYPIWAQVMQLDLQLGDHEGLHRDAEEVTSLFPIIPEPYLFNGIALTQLKRYDDAIISLVTGRDLVVDNPPLLAQFWSSLGDAYHEADQHVKSDQAYDKALEIAPNEANTLNNYAYYLSVRGEQLEKAERMSLRSNELAPGQPSYMDTYAWVLFRLGRFAEARTWMEKALAASSDADGVLLEHYGDILFELGERELATTQWRKARDKGGAGPLIERKINEGKRLE